LRCRTSEEDANDYLGRRQANVQRTPVRAVKEKIFVRELRCTEAEASKE
jgi:hypothetical protein